MAGKNKHYYRKKAAKEFGLRTKTQFHITEIVEFCNKYKNQRGTQHLRTQTNAQQMGNLLKGSKDFECITPGIWEYIGDEEE